MARYSNSKPARVRQSRTPAELTITPAEAPDYVPPVIEVEDTRAYNKYLQSLLDYYKPKSEHIERLIRTYAEAAWREERHADMVEELVNLEISERYDETEQEYPNADNRLHSAVAYRSLCAKKTLHDNSVLHARAHSITASHLRALERAIAAERGR